MTTYLLDINVLLALSDPMHLHHDAAHRWFNPKGQSAWSTCPFTENGFVRIASHPNYPNRPGDVPIVMNILRQFCATPGHCFWSANVSVLDLLSADALIPHSQIADVYLLGLAVHHGGKLATFDTKISATVIQGGKEALEIISA
jgi:toxin-antitoxin system PIN domain toxin